MKNFAYVKATTATEAAQLVTAGSNRQLLAGGVDLLDLMKEHLLEPEVLVALSGVSGLNQIEKLSTGVLRIGARVTLAELAGSSVLSSSGAKALVDAASGAATPQIRNMATLGGNLLQRPRCWYFRKEEAACLKKGGSGCPAVLGENHYLAILGGGPCYAVTASSPSIALLALDAKLNLTSATGTRQLSLSGLYQGPSVDPKKETTLAAGEVITSVEIPAPVTGMTQAYVKLRQKEAFDWAMSEVAVRLIVSGGVVSDVRIVMGAVAPIPWRPTSAENLLKGKALTTTLAAQVATEAVAGAKALSDNAWKINATKTLVEQALLAAGGLA